MTAKPDYLKHHKDAPFQYADTPEEHLANARFLMDKSARASRMAAWSMGLVGFGIILSVTVRLLTQ